MVNGLGIEQTFNLCKNEGLNLVRIKVYMEKKNTEDCNGEIDYSKI